MSFLTTVVLLALLVAIGYVIYKKFGRQLDYLVDSSMQTTGKHTHARHTRISVVISTIDHMLIRSMARLLFVSLSVRLPLGTLPCTSDDETRLDCGRHV